MSFRTIPVLLAGLLGLAACHEGTIQEPSVANSPHQEFSLPPSGNTNEVVLTSSGGYLRVTGFTTKYGQFYNPCVQSYTYSSANVVWFPNGQSFDVQRDDVTLCSGYEYYNGGAINVYITAGGTEQYVGSVNADNESMLIHELPAGTSARLVATPDNMQGCVFQTWYSGETTNPLVVSGSSFDDDRKAIFDCPPWSE